MAIDPKDVKRLRDQTGAGMMDCKRALEEAGGDFEQAKDILRKKGIVKAGKLSERAAEEGVVEALQRDGTAVMVELNCATDFVAKTERFRDLARRVAKLAAESGAADVDSLLAQPADGRALADVLTQASAELGEPVRVRRVAIYRADGGLVEVYLHQPDPALPPKVGVMVDLAVGGGADADRARGVAREIALQIAAMRPSYVSRDQIPPDEVAKEREVLEGQARDSGKPDSVIPKIVEGRLRDFYGRIALLDQPYVRDDKLTVGQLLERAAKEAGGPVSVRGFTRFRVGGE